MSEQNLFADFQRQLERFRELSQLSSRDCEASHCDGRLVSTEDRRAFASILMGSETEQEALAHIGRYPEAAKAFQKEADSMSGLSPIGGESGDAGYIPSESEYPFFLLGFALGGKLK